MLINFKFYNNFFIHYIITKFMSYANFKKNSYLIYTLIILTLFFFFFGFFNNEIPMGSGGQNGDINYVKKSLKIFSDNNFLNSINVFKETSNRPPLIYILNKYLNPYSDNIEVYRLIVFCISLIFPIFLFLALKEKFKFTNKYYLLLITFLIFLNPIYRNSSYWALEENYAYAAFFLSLYVFEKINTLKNNQLEIKNKHLIILSLVSSLCVYFDQKFVIVPLYFFLNLLFSKIYLRNKIKLFLFYFLFSIPFLYLIYLWSGIFPTNIYHIGKVYHLENLIYTPSILAFCLFPIIFLESDFSLFKIKKILLNKKFLFYICLIFFIIVYFNNFSDNHFLNNYNDGGGIMKKISHILFIDITYKSIFVYFSFLISLIIIYYFIENNIINFLIIFYFLFFSVFAKPLFQEYFDPIIIYISIFFFKKKYDFNFKKIMFYFFYSVIYLIGSISYYSYLFNFN
jgi:hypothetical protein